MTETTDANSANGWIGFDAECSRCAKFARRFGPLLGRHRLTLVPLQTPWVTERLARAGQEPLAEMRLLTARGEIDGGADALLAIARRIWWARPIVWMARAAGAQPVLRRAYASMARNRRCSGSCGVVARPGGFPTELKWIPAIVPPVLAVVLGRGLRDWVWMWVVAAALFLAAKWLTILPGLFSTSVSGRRLLAYTVLWPGMDARAFCGNGFVPAPTAREWTGAAAKTLIGAVLLWGGVPWAGTTRPLVTGWMGMVGLVLLLHFGLFHLLSLLWRALGIEAWPIMQSPATATSLSKFWGGRWNAAFSSLMHEQGFKPLARLFGATGALCGVFLVSGGLHELVISLPARGGYGLPTLYFVIQGLGVLFERSKPGRALGFGSGWKGWCLVPVVAGGPAFWLFHPAFIHNVILPMLHALGAT